MGLWQPPLTHTPGAGGVLEAPEGCENRNGEDAGLKGWEDKSPAFLAKNPVH